MQSINAINQRNQSTTKWDEAKTRSWSQSCIHHWRFLWTLGSWNKLASGSRSGRSLLLTTRFRVLGLFLRRIFRLLLRAKWNGWNSHDKRYQLYRVGSENFLLFGLECCLRGGEQDGSADPGWNSPVFIHNATVTACSSRLQQSTLLLYWFARDKISRPQLSSVVQVLPNQSSVASSPSWIGLVTIISYCHR